MYTSDGTIVFSVLCSGLGRLGDLVDAVEELALQAGDGLAAMAES